MENIFPQDIINIINEYKTSFETIEKFDKVINEFNTSYNFQLYGKFDKETIDILFSYSKNQPLGFEIYDTMNLIDANYYNCCDDAADYDYNDSDSSSSMNESCYNYYY